MKQVLVSLIALLYVNSLQAALIVRDTITNEEIAIVEVLGFATSDNPIVDLLDKDGNRLNFEFTQKSLSEIGVSKMELFDTMKTAIQDSSTDYRLVYIQDKERSHRSKLLAINITLAKTNYRELKPASACRR